MPDPHKISDAFNTQVSKLFDSATHLKFPTGAFGKTCMVLALFLLAFVGISWSSRESWVAAVALVLAFVLVGGVLWRLLNFIERNPTAALLEGAEFTKHERWTMTFKEQSLLSRLETTPSPEPEQIPEANVPALPDSPQSGEVAALPNLTGGSATATTPERTQETPPAPGGSGDAK